MNGSLRILRAALRNAVEQRELAEMPCRIKLLRETKKLPRFTSASLHATLERDGLQITRHEILAGLIPVVFISGQFRP